MDIRDLARAVDYEFGRFKELSRQIGNTISSNEFDLQELKNQPNVKEEDLTAQGLQYNNGNGVLGYADKFEVMYQFFLNWILDESGSSEIITPDFKLLNVHSFPHNLSFQHEMLEKGTPPHYVTLVAEQEVARRMTKEAIDHIKWLYNMPNEIEEIGSYYNLASRADELMGLSDMDPEDAVIALLTMKDTPKIKEIEAIIEKEMKAAIPRFPTELNNRRARIITKTPFALDDLYQACIGAYKIIIQQE